METKEIKVRLSTLILIFIIIVLLFIIGFGAFYIKNQNTENYDNSIINNSEQESNKNESVSVEDIITKNSDGTMKSIKTDLNNDGNVDNIEFTYKKYEDTESDEVYISKFGINLTTNNNKYELNFDDEMYTAMSIEIVDLDKNDNQKEILVSYSEVDASSQTLKNYFVAFRDNELKFIKVNKNSNIKKMYNDHVEEDNCIRSSFFEMIEGSDKSMELLDNQVKVYSAIYQQETYEYTDNELKLIDSGFEGTKDFYKEFFDAWGAGCVFPEKNTNSKYTIYFSKNEELYETNITKNLKIVNVEKYWIEVNIDGKTGYIAFDNAYNRPGT